MQELFEKIIEKLEERRMLHADLAQSDKLTEQEQEVQSRFCGCFCKAIKIVKQEAEQYNNGWIPVSERLPEERINPVTHDYYQYPVMFESDGVEDIKYYYFGNGHWRYGLQIMDCYVTHWMDIKPYQPKGE